MSSCSAEVEEKGVEALAEEVNCLSNEERDAVLDQIFMRDF